MTRRFIAPGLIATAIGLTASVPAAAHVKWFCAFDVTGQPVGLENVLCADFEELTVLSMAALAGGALLERTIIGHQMLRLLDVLTEVGRRHTDAIVKGTLGFFLVSLFVLGGVILTPELKTTSTTIPMIQLGMAACLLFRRTIPLASLGVVFLFLTALAEYGAFHLLDYPIFLGIAAFISLRAYGIRPFGIEPLVIMRWSAAITLMWASVEKWAYPEWTYPLFVTHAKMTMGMDPDFFMRSAGAVEFALAFGLVWTPLVRRFSAVLLALIFVSAIGEFGKIDAIGHSGIIAVLVAIICERTEGLVHAPIRTTHWRSWMKPVYLMPVSYPFSLALFLAGYYGLHAAMYSTSIL